MHMETVLVSKTMVFASIIITQNMIFNTSLLKKKKKKLQLYCPLGMSSLGNSGCFPKGNSERQLRYQQPMVHAGCFNVSLIHSDMDYRIFNMSKDVNTCDCIGGVWTHVGETALKVDFGRKVPYRTEELSLHQRRAGLTLYQLSYIPAQFSILENPRLK